MAERLNGAGDRRAGPSRTAGEDFSFREFGGSTRRRERRVTVGTVMAQILANNPDRVRWLIQNRSSVDGALSYSQQGTVGNSLLLTANGGYVMSAVRDDGDVTGDEVFGVSNAAGASWYVLEILRYRTRGVGSAKNE